MRVCDILVCLSVFFLPIFGLPTNEETTILTRLQSNYYEQVKIVLEAITAQADQLYFVDDDLKANAGLYLDNLSSEALQELRAVEEACESNNKCLACFDHQDRISETAHSASTYLVQYFEDQKAQYQSTIASIKSDIQEAGLLSTVVYEKYGSRDNFESNANAFYAKMKETLDNDVVMFESLVEKTEGSLIGRDLQVTAQASETIQRLKEEIIECADAALNP